MADETNQLRVRLVTPERTLFESPATAVELPAKNGYFEVLYGHAPTLAELGAGDVIVHTGADITDGTTQDSSRFNVSWGFVEVLPRPRSPSSPTTRSSPKKSTYPAPSSNSIAASSCGRMPGKTKKPTPTPSASSPKPKPKSPPPPTNNLPTPARSNQTPCSTEQGVLQLERKQGPHQWAVARRPDSLSRTLRAPGPKCFTKSTTDSPTH